MGLTAILVGVMTLVLTALAAITGLGFYKSHRAFERQKDKLTNQARSDIDYKITEFINRQVNPKLQQRIDKLDIKFWRQTAIARQLETEYWLKLSKSGENITKALERNNKFKMAIANILSEKDITNGLGLFYHLKSSEIPFSFEKSLYLLYQQGIFLKTEFAFESFIKYRFHLGLEPWLEKNQTKTGTVTTSF